MPSRRCFVNRMIQIVVIADFKLLSFYVEEKNCLDAARLLSEIPGAYSLGMYRAQREFSLSDAWRTRRRYDTQEWVPCEGVSS